jgi:Zn-dependent protease
MKAQIKLGRVFGVEIGLQYNWFVIALLITLSLAEHFGQTNPDWPRGVTWLLALVTAGLFFAALIAHELAHATVARARGLPVRSITLFALGGVAQIEKEAMDPKTEFWMGIVGPVASALIGAAFLALAAALGWVPTGTPPPPLLAMLVWLGYINIGLAAFNMVPGFPLDGGRVLRAILWWTTGDARRSTQIAARVGQIVAFGFIVLGISRFFAGAGIGGLWIAFIGWFLMEASRASQVQVEMSETLRGVRVGDVMARGCPVVDGSISVQALVEEHVFRTGQRCHVVAENGAIVGLITPHEVKRVERGRWPHMTVTEVMRPLSELRTVSPDTPALAALETMVAEDVNQLPVVSGGRLEGIVSRAHVLQLLKTRAELGP